MNVNTDPTTTTMRGYSLLALANNALMEAQTKRHAAYVKADCDPSYKNLQEFIEADNAFKTAERNLQSVRMMQKHNRRI